GVPNVPIEPADNELARGIDGRWRASAEGREVPDAAEIDRGAGGDHENGEHGRPARGRRAAGGDHERKVAAERAGRDDREHHDLEEEPHRHSSPPDAAASSRGAPAPRSQQVLVAPRSALLASPAEAANAHSATHESRAMTATAVAAPDHAAA